MDNLNSGIYLLNIYLKKDCVMKTGALGKTKYKRGYYFYIGSAQRNLKARIKRHLSKDKKFHWHIDYLLDNAKIVKYVIFNGEKSLECSLYQSLKEDKDFEVPIEDFGSSDCKCKSHLLYSKEKVDLRRHLEQIEQEFRIIKPGVKN